MVVTGNELYASSIGKLNFNRKIKIRINEQGY